jgi:hypothetical protein
MQPTTRRRAADVEIDDVGARLGDDGDGVGHVLEMVAHHLHGQRGAGGAHHLVAQVPLADARGGDAHEFGTHHANAGPARDERTKCRVRHAFHRGEEGPGDFGTGPGNGSHRAGF